MKNVVCFNKGFICLPSSSEDNRSYAMTVQAELMKFGFMLDHDAMVMLGNADKADIVDFYNEVVNYLLDITGGRHNYVPFYKGFPVEVMGLSQYDMWLDQITNYITNGKWEPKPWMKPFEKAFESVKYKMITAGDESKFLSIFTDLCCVNQSLTPSDLKVIKWFVESKQTLIFPPVIPFKENLCTLAAMGLDVPVKTPTDVLRIAVHMSGGDISLPAVPRKTIKSRTGFGYRRQVVSVNNPEREKFKFKKFSRSDRRLILGLLEKTHCDPREMVLKDQRWIRLGEILHPGEYEKQFPKAYQAFKAIRNDKVMSWYGEVNLAFSTSFSAGLNKLSERPGEFLRKLDLLIRNAEKHPQMLQMIFNTFSKVASKSSNKVLFEVFTHFEERNKPVTGRSIFIKGARKKTQLPDLPALEQSTIDAVQEVIFSAVKEKFSNLESLGDCWIDPELKKIPLPTNMRSMSESLVPIIRGQRIPIGNVKKTLRVFMHFPNKPRTGITIDLSCMVSGKNRVERVDWTRLKLSDLILHSGDSYGRMGNVAEYIDLDVKKLKNSEFDWILVQLNNFNNSPQLVNGSIFGFCEVEFPHANQLWQPDTIISSMKVKVPSKVNLMLIDLKNLDYIMLDEDGEKSGFNNISASDIKKVIENYGELPKYSVYDLLQWHVEARGRMVPKESAETHFLFDDFSTSYVETLKFMGV